MLAIQTGSSSISNFRLWNEWSTKAREINVDDGNKDNSNGEKDDDEQISEEVQWINHVLQLWNEGTEFINAMELADKALFPILFSHRYNITTITTAA